LIDHPEEGTLLAMLVQSSAEDDDGLSSREIQSNIVTFGHAGIDAITSALTSIVYMLIKYPEVQTKVRNEIKQVIGEGTPDYYQLKGLTYLTMVIKETLRLCPPYPVLFPRVAKKADKLAGFYIPAKTTVIVDVVGHNRHPSYWVDPDTFNPERFAKGADESTEKALKQYNLTWGIGPRASVGKKLSMLILRTSIISILGQYDIVGTNAEKANVEIVRSLGTLKPQPDLLVRVSS